MKTKLFIIAIFNVLLAFTSGCNSSEVESADIEQVNYLDIIFDLCPEAEILETESSGNGLIEIDYLCNNYTYEATILDGELLYVERELDAADIFYKTIKETLKKKYSDRLLDEILEVTTPDTVFYKAEIIKNGMEENLYFSAKGEKFKIKKLGFSENEQRKEIFRSGKYFDLGYKFSYPDINCDLPDILREISGISVVSDTLIYCIQDELGAIFEFDPVREEIKQMYRFTDIGDFEDIAVINGLIYVLRSDGKIFEYSIEKGSIVGEKFIQTDSPDIEGMCVYGDFLYISNKAEEVNQDVNCRSIHRINLQTRIAAERFLEININELNSFLIEKYGLTTSIDFDFNPSGLDFNPTTGELYVLSATDRLIAVFKDKQLTNIIPLAADRYYKPEGISFSRNGDLYISSEGDKKGFSPGKIFMFKANK
jgi:hypothetical protein